MDERVVRPDVTAHAGAFCFVLLHLKGLTCLQDSKGESSPCSDCWKNIINNMSSKAWGIFDETRMFIVLCHYGFVLLAADMVCSGEL